MNIQIKLTKKMLTTTGKLNLDVDLTVDKGSFIALTGVSGSGKTTLLRCIAGLSNADSGFIRCGDDVWLDTSKKKNLPVRYRKLGFVFQDYALFPNMTLRENILYACSDRQAADLLIDLAGLGSVAGLYPHHLSGGQKQRCALLRAVSRRPKMLLLDEPFAALDAETKSIFHHELLRWKSSLDMTVLLVTHDRSEVVRLADRVVTIRNGHVESDLSHMAGCCSRSVAAKMRSGQGSSHAHAVVRTAI